MRKPGILIISQTYPPDVGGVETHLEDMTALLAQRPQWNTWIVAYKPIVTDVKEYKRHEQRGSVKIRRFWWIGGNLFRKLESNPPLMFLYIVPYFLVRTFLYTLPIMRKIDVIHVHGINSAVVGLVLAKLYRKRIVFQSHTLYSFVPGSAFARVTELILKRMDYIWTLCTASSNEFTKLGVPIEKLGVYIHWIDLDSFIVRQRPISNKFVALFVGRLMGIKGEKVVIELARQFPHVQFRIAGGGPNEQMVVDAMVNCQNIEYLGFVPNATLPGHYRAADVLLVPSQYPEGFGRVICEALACGTPVIASNVGGIPDAMDATVGILCDINVESFASALQKLLADPSYYQTLCTHARPYAEARFSARNADPIFSSYCLPQEPS